MIRYVTPVSRKSATGVTATVYEQMAREFGVHAEPIVLHSPLPDLLAAAWALVREHLVAEGRLDRPVKEAIATTVSSINRCPFCVDAHAVMLDAGGEGAAARELEKGRFDQVTQPQLAPAVAWAAATRSPGSEALERPPFEPAEPAEAAEAVGTAVLFHYMNRPVSVFLDDSPLPGGGLLRGGMLRLAARRFRTVARARPAAGAALDLLPQAELPGDLAWAAGSAPIAAAWAAFAAAAERAGGAALSEPVRAAVGDRLAAWDGDEPPLGFDWLEQDLERLEQHDRPAARLALLVALAPHRVDEAVVSSYLRSGALDGVGGDARLLGAVAWPALAAARRVASWLAVPSGTR